MLISVSNNYSLHPNYSGHSLCQMVSLWYSCEYVPHASVLLMFPLLFPSSHLPTPICPKCLFPKWLLSILSQFESLHSEGNIINAMFFFLCLFFSVNMMSSSTHFLANDMLLIFLFGFLSLYSSALSLPPRSTSFLIKLIRMTSVLLCNIQYIQLHLLMNN